MRPQDYRDDVFKGCTRPAMVFGVPVFPLIGAGIAVLIIAQMTTILSLALMVPIVLVMGAVTRSDDQQYRLLWLRFYCRVLNRNANGGFWRASTYAPVKYRKIR